MLPLSGTSELAPNSGRIPFPEYLQTSFLQAILEGIYRLAAFIVNAFVPTGGDRARREAGTVFCDETPFEIREKLDCSDSYISGWSQRFAAYGSD